MARRAIRSWLTAVGMVLLCAMPSLSFGHAVDDRLARVQSAFVLNFMKFTEWPAEAMPEDDQPLTLAVIGHDHLGPHLDATFEGRTVHGRPVQITRHGWPRRDSEAWRSLVEQLRGAQLVYLAEGHREDMRALLEALGGGASLLVVEDHRDMRGNAMLGFSLEEGRVVFYADVGEIDRSSVRVSSKVLRLAKRR